jgi:hypothetical protein
MYYLYSCLYRPCNTKELFNLHHSQLQNIIKHIFGMDKKRFRVLANSTCFSPKKQAHVVIALLAIFNFIVMFDPDHANFFFDPNDWRSWDFDMATRHAKEAGNEGELGGDVTAEESTWADEGCDCIAQAMWEQYSTYNAGCNM